MGFVVLDDCVEEAVVRGDGDVEAGAGGGEVADVVAVEIVDDELVVDCGVDHEIVEPGSGEGAVECALEREFGADGGFEVVREGALVVRDDDEAGVVTEGEGFGGKVEGEIAPFGER